MLVKTEIANEFPQKYKHLMRLLNNDAEPKNINKYAILREQIYKDIERIEKSFSEIIGVDFISSLRLGDFGRFAYLQKYKAGYAMCSLQNKKYYLVLALTTPLEEFVNNYSIITTAIIPYKGFILCDGIIVSQNITIGKNMSKDLRDEYWLAKKNSELTCTNKDLVK